MDWKIETDNFLIGVILLGNKLAKCWYFCVRAHLFVSNPWPDLLPNDTRKCKWKVDLPEIKGNHRKFRNLVTSYIGNCPFVSFVMSILLFSSSWDACLPAPHFQCLLQYFSSSVQKYWFYRSVSLIYSSIRIIPT